MVLLKCLEHFKPSDSNVYSEEEMQKINIDVLAERGVSIDDIASLAYWAQSKYLDNLTLEEMRESVLEILNKRDQFHAILLAVQLDVLAERHLLQEPLQAYFMMISVFWYRLGDRHLHCCNYGTIGVTNFGNKDVNKTSKISILQNKKTPATVFSMTLSVANAAVVCHPGANDMPYKKPWETLT
jgi:phosphatidylglycerophosphatase A